MRLFPEIDVTEPLRRLSTMTTTAFIKNSLYLSLKSIVIGVKLLYNAVLVCTVEQSEPVMCTHICPFFWISFPFKSPQSNE